MRFQLSAFVAALGLLAPVLTPSEARADESIIKNVGDHPEYRFEAEPHGILGFGGPFDRGRADFGAGFRGTVIFLDNGFLKNVNNNVGITFGADIFARNATFFIPVGLQWNFWLSTHWSVFAEPGIGFAANRTGAAGVVHPVLMIGGRYHFSDKVALTLRLGYPSISVGASFFL